MKTEELIRRIKEWNPYCEHITLSTIFAKMKSGKGRCHVINHGTPGCLPEGTKIKTSQGFVNIEDVKDKILSYNFENDIIEETSVNKFYSGKKRIYKIHTTEGIIECSVDHKWWVMKNNKLLEIKTKDLNIGMKLIKV